MTLMYRAPFVRRALPALLAALLGACVDTPRDDALLVLAASSLQGALPEIAARYEAETGRRVQPVFGSSGSLATQVEHGSPADLFLAANERFVDRLAERGHVLDASRTLYGVGRLVLVGAPGAAPPASLDDLVDARYAAIAIANPEHAPYGVAAREALLARGLWSAVQPRLVYGETIAQTLQLVRSGNADAGIVSLALVRRGDAVLPHVIVDDALHAPLRQAAAVLAASRRQDEARDFLAFVTGPAGREVLRRHGIAPPPAP